MVLALPVVLLGLSGLSVSSPTVVGRGQPEPSEWISEPIHDTSSMKTTNVPLLQCNSYHSPVQSWSGDTNRHTVWKFCNDNDRGSVYIHETTPYANRNDVEIPFKQCRTHKNAVDKHKIFQVCNRGFNALKLQNLKVKTSITVEENPRVINRGLDLGPYTKHKDVKHGEQINEPKIENPNEVKLEEPHKHLEEKHEFKHQEKHEFKHEEKHEIHKGEHDDKNVGEHNKDENHEKHEPNNEEKHMVKHEEKHDRLKHMEKHVLKSDGDKHEHFDDQRYVEGGNLGGRVAKRHSGFWSSKAAKDDFYYRHGPRMHEVKYKDGHIEPVLHARSAFFTEKHEEYRPRERFPKEHHSKHGKHDDKHRGYERVGLHGHDLHDHEQLHDELQQNHIVPRYNPGDEDFRGELLDIGEERGDRSDDVFKKHSFFDEIDREHFAKHHHKDKGNKEKEHNQTPEKPIAKPIEKSHEKPREVHHEEHQPLESHNGDAFLHGDHHHLDIPHKDHVEERKHKGHKQHQNHEHKHNKHQEEQHGHLDILHKEPFEHLHHKDNNDNTHKKHKHHENKHSKHQEDEQHHHLDILHKEPLEHLHHKDNHDNTHKKHKNHENKHNKHQEEEQHHHLDILHKEPLEHLHHKDNHDNTHKKHKHHENKHNKNQEGHGHSGIFHNNIFGHFHHGNEENTRKEHKHHDNKHNKNQEGHGHLGIFHKNIHGHFHHDNEEDTRKEHKHHDNKHNRQQEGQHHHLDILHKEPLEHLHHNNEDNRNDKQKHHGHKHDDRKHRNNNNRQNNDAHHDFLDHNEFGGGEFGR